MTDNTNFLELFIIANNFSKIYNKYNKVPI